jgi:bacillithiol biosynthesis cysteine-adding enzyme BshC
VVVAGQQPGLLGGPLYTFSKAVAAARWAAALEERGEPAVGVFWVATEDHDFREVARATVLGPEGPKTFDLGEDPAPLTPVGARTFGPAVEGVLAGLAEAVPGERWAEWVATLARWYRPDARFGEAFCRLLVHLLGARCPLLLDAMDPGVKAAERPWLERLVERRAEVEAASAAADRELEARGYPLQVHPQRGAAPLFLLHAGGRRRIEWTAGGFALRGAEGAGGTAADLLAIVRDNPAVVSPGALARPAVQDAILGTDLFLVGPGELSYLPQAAPVYRVLEVTAPAAALRPQALVLERREVEQLAELGLDLGQLLGERAALDRALAARAGGDPVSGPRARIAAALDDIAGPALALDANLEAPWSKTREQIERALDRFADRTAAAAARRDQVRLGRVERLRETLLPGGTLQERVISTAYYPGKHRERFADACWEQMDLDGGALQVVTP